MIVAPFAPHKYQGVRLEVAFGLVRGLDGQPLPDEWPSGLVHPSLPPRPLAWTPLRPRLEGTMPATWRRPQAQGSEYMSIFSLDRDVDGPVCIGRETGYPSPSNIQLNPILRHRRWGPPTLVWDIEDQQSTALYLSTQVPASPPNVNLFDSQLRINQLRTGLTQETVDGDVPTVVNYPADLPPRPRPRPHPFRGIPILNRVRPTPDYPMSPAIIPVPPSDWAQPATHPFLDNMEIVAVAEDPSLSFPWRITVTNPRGILVEDVLRCIYQIFQENVSRHEYESWDPATREAADAACWRRSLPRNAAQRGQGREEPDERDVTLKRIDWLGERCMFRGLERDEEGGWILFVGPVG